MDLDAQRRLKVLRHLSLGELGEYQVPLQRSGSDGAAYMAAYCYERRRMSPQQVLPPIESPRRENSSKDSLDLSNSSGAEGLMPSQESATSLLITETASHFLAVGKSFTGWNTACAESESSPRGSTPLTGASPPSGLMSSTHLDSSEEEIGARFSARPPLMLLANTKSTLGCQTGFHRREHAAAQTVTWLPAATHRLDKGCQTGLP